MKKKYEAPAMETVIIEPTCLLAGSDKSLKVKNNDDDYDEIL